MPTGFASYGGRQQIATSRRKSAFFVKPIKHSFILSQSQTDWINF
jgi:hypothetical protein